MTKVINELDHKTTGNNESVARLTRPGLKFNALDIKHGESGTTHPTANKWVGNHTFLLGMITPIYTHEKVTNCMTNG
jgi:hypothetical protein